MMAMAFLLAALAALKTITVREILVISFLSGLATALNAPTYQAMVPELVPAADLSNAIAMNSAQFNLSRMLGPFLAGLALACIGSAGCFFLNGLSFLALLYPLTRLRLPPPGRAAESGLWEPLWEGFPYIRAQRVLSTLLLWWPWPASAPCPTGC